MRTLTLFCAFAASVFFAMCTNAQSNLVPVETTITEISKKPWAFHDKIVRVKGTFNECVSYTCRMCDSETPVNSYDDEVACMGTSFLDKGQEEFVRYSTVEITAKYDATCSGVSEQADADEIIVCTDRATQLGDSFVTKMVTERTPNQGIVSSYGEEMLLSAINKEKEAIIAETLADLPTWYDVTSSDIDYVFFIHDEDSKNREAAICECYEETDLCEKIKPTLKAHVFYLQSDTPYSCIFAEERDGQWHVAPN